MWTYRDNCVTAGPAWDTMKADDRDQCDQWKRRSGCHHVGEDDIGRHKEVVM
jgi:hypothetical protein